MTPQKFEERFGKYDPTQVIRTPAVITNRQLKEPIKRGEPFLTTKFYLSGTGPSIANKLPPGYRAIRVEVPVTREAAVRPGMLVDVYFRAKSQAAKPDQLPTPEKTLRLFKHLEVLTSEPPTAHGRASGTAKNEWYFTLAVPETKVDYFSIIENRGDLWLVPTPADGDAPPEDAAQDVADVSTLSELLGVTPPRQPPPPFETAIYRRDKIQINKFVDGKLLSKNVSERGAKPDKNNLAPTADSPAALPEEKE